MADRFARLQVEIEVGNARIQQTGVHEAVRARPGVSIHGEERVEEHRRGQSDAEKVEFHGEDVGGGGDFGGRTEDGMVGVGAVLSGRCGSSGDRSFREVISIHFMAIDVHHNAVAIAELSFIGGENG